VGCSRKTVQRVAAAIKPDVQEVEGKLELYGRLLRKKLPIKDRVELYDRIARKAESDPFAAMRALERADELDGILTAKDKSREAETPRPQQPMFIMPPGANVQVNVWNRPEERTVEAPAIDVTP